MNIAIKNPGLDMVDITSTYMPLARTELRDVIQLLGRQVYVS